MFYWNLSVIYFLNQKFFKFQDSWIFRYNLMNLQGSSTLILEHLKLITILSTKFPNSQTPNIQKSMQSGSQVELVSKTNFFTPHSINPLIIHQTGLGLNQENQQASKQLDKSKTSWRNSKVFLREVDNVKIILTHQLLRHSCKQRPLVCTFDSNLS